MDCFCRDRGNTRPKMKISNISGPMYQEKICCPICLVDIAARIKHHFVNFIDDTPKKENTFQDLIER